MKRRGAWWLGLALMASACGSQVEDVRSLDPVAGLPDGPSALADAEHPAFPDPLIDPGDIVRVLPADAIPAIDQPQFLAVDVADEMLADQEAVIAVEIDGDARAYPVGILTFHEIVNDRVGGVPVSVTYCPLCNSAVTFERTVRGVETTFGVSGRLFNSALVMYDRASHTMWTHFDGRAVVGALTGERLTVIGSPLLAWGDFKDAFPDGRVLDPDRTGFPSRRTRYFQNPYDGYDEVGTRTLFPTASDGRLDLKERVVALTVEDTAIAWRLDAVAGGEARVTSGEVAGNPVVIFWKSGQASALETNRTGIGSDVGSIGVFVPAVDGSALTFRVEGGMFVDQESGSVWDITGRAVAGVRAGERLERIPHLDTFWFAWSSYRPDSLLVESG